MSCEIPQQLEYKEKIIFGLTFSQLLWAIIFLPIALALLFKTPFKLTYRVILALIPSTFAIIFMFTKLPQQAMNWIHWLHWRKMQRGDKKMKEFLNVEKIEGEIFHTK